MVGNAQIEKTFLGFEDHGIFTCYLYLKQPGSGQALGGYSISGEYGSFWITKILETVGVQKWEDLQGKYVRVVGQKWGPIEGIGHITEEKWFYPKTDKPKGSK